MSLRSPVLLTLLSVLASLTLPSVARGEKAHTPRADFDHNGCGDLAIGILYEDLGSAPVVEDAGAVVVLYGQPQPQGLEASGAQLWYQGGSGLGDSYEANDYFANSLAAGDFDRDGYVDLVVGVPREDIGTALNGGAVHVIYGAPGGLAAPRSALWHQGSPGIDGAVETGDYFGSALAIGDFNADGYADVAIGVPEEDLEGVANYAGAVNVLYGSSSGLAATGNQLWTQDSDGVLDQAENGDYFGGVLAAGDFDGDGETDLAIGVTGEDLEGLGRDRVGVVNVLYGGSGGLTAIGSTKLGLDDVPGAGASATGDRFGSALASLDLDGDGYADLAVGIADRDVGSSSGAGAVALFYGAPVGLTEIGSQYIVQDAALSETAEDFDYFGETLAGGDFNADGYDDLVIGVPFENEGGTPDAGIVHVLYGSSSGLSGFRQLWRQSNPALADAGEANDRFGDALAAGDFNCDGFVDLAVGSPTETLSGVSQSGAVHVIYGSSNGLVSTGSEFWHQDLLDPVEAETGDNFGGALATAFTPYLFVDGFESGSTDGWSATTP